MLQTAMSFEESNTNDVSLDEFLNVRDSKLQELQTKTDSYFATQLAQLYIDDGLEDVFEKSFQLALSYLKGEEECPVFDNSIPGEHESDDFGKNQSNIIHAYQNNVKEAFLLIKAPINNPKGFSKDKEEEMRENQYRHFCSVYPSLCKNEESIAVREVTVHENKELMEEVENFMKKCTHVTSAVIVFNGHGGKDGLYLDPSKDGTGKGGQFTQLNDFVKKVQDSMGSHFPLEVEIIFAQCWGHRHGEPGDQRIHVTSFTSDSKPKTHNIRVPKGSPLDFKHKQMQGYAEKKAEENRDSQQMDITSDEEYTRGRVSGSVAESMDLP